MNLIQAFSPPNKVRMSIPHPYGMGLKYIGFAALSGNGYVQGTRCPNANFANGRESTQITAFVIPNVVRNLASNALGVRPWASGGEPTEQRAGRKKIRLSEPSELPDFSTCERREGV